MGEVQVSGEWGELDYHPLESGWLTGIMSNTAEDQQNTADLFLIAVSAFHGM